MPSSRLTTTAWLFMAPTSTTTAPAMRNSGVHAASVKGATRTSPGSSRAMSDGSVRTQTRPVTRPAPPPSPDRTSPSLSSGMRRSVRRGHCDSGAGSAAMMNGGSSSNSSS